MPARSTMRAQGYPDRHWPIRRRTIRLSLCFLVGSGLLAALFLSLAMRWSTWDVPAALSLVVFLLVLICSCVSVYDVVRCITVIPYFTEHVRDVDTFTHGHFLARHIKQLDAIADSLGVARPSTFGFADDLWGETVTWHDAAEGVTTFDALISRIEGDPADIAEREGLLDDLKRVAHALGRAKEKGIRFCLLLRYGNATSGQEWCVRQGTAF